VDNQSFCDEKALIELISGGDQKAFAQLVDMHWNKIYSHALAFLKSSIRAQEITQDIFLHIWNKRDKLRNIENFNNYFFILGRNRIISAMRKKLMKPFVEVSLNQVEELYYPDRQLETKQTWEFLVKGIEELPPTRKIVFKMSRLEGLSYKKIASQLHISKNTVKDHIRLALTQLRQYAHTHLDHFILILPYCLLFSA
jgi:RNA polymerase sigma-70 factor (ECF subfamily)